MLYIVPTPIGNLKDITLRAIETLEACDYVLCEDTRNTSFLLGHLHIQKKLVAFHMHNEKSMEERVLEDLKGGKNIALVSDAGTPSINDPGIFLIHACHQRGIPVTALPGPSSVTTALALSGINADKFQFLGFFPRKQSEREKLVEEILSYDGVSIFFESPKRVMKSLNFFPKDQTMYVAKELSKLHEALFIFPSEEAKNYEDRLTRGELCILVRGSKSQGTGLDVKDEFLIKTLSKYLSKSDAAKAAAELTGKKKKDFYLL